jgi:predicted metalloprotease with PDZ domain
MTRLLPATFLLCLWVLPSAAQVPPPTSAAPPAPVSYDVRFPEPEHHWAEIEATFTHLESAPLRARMSRSSPGRYAVHEFAKNVFAVEARDGQGRLLFAARPDVDEWRVEGHDGTVRLTYRIFGDTADGTYMAVDTTHAHLNIPATFMWAVGLEQRPVTVTLTPPAGSGWRAGTQLFPTSDPFRFTAPNLQYFMDSPIELADLVVSTFTVARETGPPALFRVMVHARDDQAGQADVDALAALIERLVREQRAVFGEIPALEPGHYTFLIDVVPWAAGDAMEHRNSTYISAPGAILRTPGGRLATLDPVSHELFHLWNVERIRPVGLEPFDFTRQNVTCCLWLGEGFTQYYGPLLRHRAGLLPQMPLGSAVAVINGPGRLVRSAVEMSEHAPFADAGIANDVDDRSRTFISYYTYGAALAIALDLSLREHSDGRVTLDDYMRRLWRDFGAAEGAPPGYVARPYSLADARRTLATVSSDPAFADVFFDRYVEGREAPDYARLLAHAGYLLRPAAPERAWMGAIQVQESGGGLLIGSGRFGGRAGLVPFGTPAYAAGLDSGDRIVAIDGQPATQARWAALSSRAVGSQVRLEVERRDGEQVTTTATLAADPALQVVDLAEAGTITPEQRAFRRAWLESRVE